MELEGALVYARALYDAAEDLGTVDEMRREINTVDMLVAREPKFVRCLMTPNISAADKKKMLAEIFSGKVMSETLNFLFILADNGRFRISREIVRQFNKICDEKEGVSDGIVYSVVPLDDEQMRKLCDETSKLLKKKVALRNEVDKSLLGGVKILADEKEIDASLRSRLNELEDRIRDRRKE